VNFRRGSGFGAIGPGAPDVVDGPGDVSVSAASTRLERSVVEQAESRYTKSGSGLRPREAERRVNRLLRIFIGLFAFAAVLLLAV